MRGFLRELVIAGRTIQRQPGAYAFAVAVLVAGIGISTAVFSLAEAVLWAPLPFPHQNQLEVIYKSDQRAGTGVIELAYPELGDLQSGVPGFSSVALMPTTLYGYGKVLQVDGRQPVQVESTPVSHDFFRTLGVQPVLGRDFTGKDEHVGAAPVAILSDATWRRVFGADAGIIGKVIRMNGAGCQVIGVMGRDVEFPRGAGLWVPLGVYRQVGDRTATYLQAIARRRDGFSHGDTVQAVETVMRRVIRQFPAAYASSQHAVVTPLPDYWTGTARLQLEVSLLAALLLLLMGCLTASNLLLSRALGRATEIATRWSLGATARQMVSHFAAEGVVLGAAAGAGGVALAWGLIRLLLPLAPADIPRLDRAGISGPVVAFAVGMALLTAVACTVAPALLAMGRDTERVLRAGSSRLAGSRRSRVLQSVFVGAEMALTLALVTTAALLVLTVRNLLATDTGFAHRDAVTMNLALHGAPFDRDGRERFFGDLLHRLRAEPDITAAGAVLLRPFEGSIGWDMRYRAAFNREQRRDELKLSGFQVVTPGYFGAVGIPVVEGRDFDDRDTRTGQQTVILSRSLAKRFRDAGIEPIGQRFQLGAEPLGPDARTVVGVVGDTRDRSVVTAGDTIYVPYTQAEVPVNYVAVRGRGTPAEVTATVRRAVAAIDAGQALAGVATLGSLIERDTERQRFLMTLLLVFGAGAVLLAAAGVFSVVAESVHIREQEIGIRLALGAKRSVLAGQLVGESMRAAGWGWFVGQGAFSLLVYPALSGLMYGIRDETVPLGIAGGVLVLLALVAAEVPAWRATGRSPSEALRL